MLRLSVNIPTHAPGLTYSESDCWTAASKKKNLTSETKGDGAGRGG